MSQLPTLFLCHISPERGDERNSARLLRDRATFLPSLAASVGCEIHSIDSSVLKWEPVGEASFQEALEAADAIWWVGLVTYLDDMELLYSRLQQHTGGLASPPKIFERPDAVEESFHLSQQYYRLLGTDVRQAETAFCSLGFDPVEYSVDDMATRLRSVLTEEIEPRWDELSGEAGRVFFRTDYGTQKQSAYLNAARSFEDLVEGCVVMVESLRHHQPIRGLAIRQWLPIHAVVDDLLGDKFRQEYRLFVIDGKVAGWVWEPGRLMGETDSIQKRVTGGRLDELAPDEAMLSNFSEVAALVGRNLRSRFMAVDVARLDDGSMALIEINPGHCAGWGHDAIKAGVYGAWMQAMLGLPTTPQAHCEALEMPRWGEGVVFGF